MADIVAVIHFWPDFTLINIEDSKKNQVLTKAVQVFLSSSVCDQRMHFNKKEKVCLGTYVQKAGKEVASVRGCLKLVEINTYKGTTKQHLHCAVCKHFNIKDKSSEHEISAVTDNDGSTIIWDILI